MILYITRHGQCFAGKTVGGDTDYPLNDPPISELGFEQAALLGKHMEQIGFRGSIYASPFRRTLNTAQTIAAHTSGGITLAWRLREIAKTDESFRDFTGMTAVQCQEEFPAVIPGQFLPNPWWTVHAESFEDVCARVEVFIDEVLEKGEDCLAVTHGAPTAALNHVLLERSGYRVNEKYAVPPFAQNVGLSAYAYQNGVLTPLLYYDCGFIPALMRSSNATMQFVPIAN